jgi:Uma2 family endonuclease
MSPHPLAGRRVSLAEYHSLVRDGGLGEDDKVQLLGGTIVAMTPQGVAHARVIRELNEHFVLAVSGRAKVLVQLPLTLGDDSEPEPDVALISRDEASRPDGHPRTALLVVEVAGESLRQDRELKSELYARAGIPEYWIVDLDARCLELYRDPDRAAGRYRSALRAAVPDSIAPAAFPDAILPIDLLFPGA